MVSKSRSTAVIVGRLLSMLMTAASLGAAEAEGSQLAATWVDNSNGTAVTRLERRLRTDTTFDAIAEVPPGVTQYVDASVGAGLTYCYRALAYNAAGVSPYSPEACATPTGTLTLSFTNPASGATVSGTATVSLNAGGGSGYTFTVKADGTTIYAGTNESFSWNTTAMADGSHTLTATVTDSQNRTATASRTVTVSNLTGSPEGFEVAFTSPASSATVSGSQSVGLSTTAAWGQAKTFTLSVDGTVLTSQSVSTGTTVSYIWDTTKAGNGPRTLTATVTVAGQTATATLSVTVSNGSGTPPPPAPLSAAFTAPTAGATVNGMTTVNMASSGASGSSTFLLAVDGTAVSTQTVTGSTASYAWNTTAAASGARTLSLTVTDAAARTATATLAVTVSSGPASTGPCSAAGQPVLNVPASHATIQAAINAASDGSCIVVAPGTYSVNLQISGRYVELKAASADPTQTILDGGQLGSVVVFQNVPYNASVPFIQTARLTGFTIQNGKSIEGQGGGITLANRADVFVTNNILRNNVSAMDGGGILVYNRSHATIRNNTFTGNTAPRFGGGMFVVGDGSPGGGSNPVVYNNVFTSNATTGFAIPNGGAAGGGLFVDLFSAPTIIGNTFSGNTAPFAGGAISLRAGVGGAVEDNLITGNAAAYGGGVHIETEGAAVLVRANTLRNNTALFNPAFPGSGFGGGISVYAQSLPTIVGNTIADNTATYGGGGIVVAEGASATIRANTISGNVVNGNPGGSPIGPPPGGGIYVSQATA
ncbi:MAG: right-handed parallel beta-helix repeat-containing protein, partial [Gammaproteobacteria bacterium]